MLNGEMYEPYHDGQNASWDESGFNNHHKSLQSVGMLNA